jgi:molybdenum-dependent DNA-binding transcriptional regulator ModE
MAPKIDWESQIGRRLRLRDLHVLHTVVQHGSMAKAAVQLGVSQPAVSEVIADLEHALGVRLLDRSSRGIEPTMYGNALLKRSVAVFDELKQSIRDIEFLADPTTGEVKIACPLAIAFTIIPHVIERFVKQYPRVVVHFDEVASASATRDFRELRERKYDLILGRGSALEAGQPSADDLNIECLFDDQAGDCRRGEEQMGGPSPQDRSCRAYRRALDNAGTSHMEPPEPVGGLPRARSRYAESQPGDAVHVGHYPFPRRWPVHNRNAEVGGVLQVAQSVACRFAGPAMAGQHHDAEESNPEPSGRTLRRVCARGHATDARGKAGSEAIDREHPRVPARTEAPAVP